MENNYEFNLRPSLRYLSFKKVKMLYPSILGLYCLFSFTNFQKEEGMLSIKFVPTSFGLKDQI